MKFTLAWLKEHLDTKASVETIAATLTRIGLEVEEVFDPATAFAGKTWEVRENADAAIEAGGFVEGVERNGIFGDAGRAGQ